MSIVAALVFATLYIMSGTAFFWMAASLHNINNPTKPFAGSQFSLVAFWPFWWCFVAYGYYRGVKKD